MKITAPLLLLPLLLAACGTQNAAPAATHANALVAPGQTTATGSTYVEAFEASVQRDLMALGLSGSISAQATAPKSYLNVLKVNESTARAYMKTTYPTTTGCALDWGDNTASTKITTPSVVATDQADHTYTQSGTYTVKLTCGTDIKTSTFAAVVPVTDLNLFDDFTSTAWFTEGAAKAEFATLPTTYSTQGFKFLSSSNYMTRKAGLISGHNAIIISCVGTVQATSGALFDVKTLTGSSVLQNTTVTAYGADNTVIGSTVFSNEHYYAGAPAETRTLNWKNVKRIENTCNGGYGYLLIDDMSATIQLPPV
ncbi:hypothetical protein [Deinococcus sp. Leaf326]|uniref:hypothetical protein n=1 Tax=Deinococcus sp. Leaf326 TaxID=1736338 RepID=UPI00070135AD|nr:hypothetical protein [Deinococcus sp. Leaf326]KQQ97732.1 hypothetical protein ASF71_22070 [Deinococcus sp. Leaf326]